MNKLDILIVCMNADRPTSGYATRVFSMGRTLVDAGYKVGALRLVPAFHKAMPWKNQFHNIGVKICYEFKVPPISRFATLRSVAIPYGHLLTKRLARRHRIRAIQCEAHSAAKSVLNHDWPDKVNIIADIHGAAAEEEDYYRQIAGLRVRGKHHWLKQIESKILDKATRVIVVSEKMKRHLESQGSTKRVVIIPIGIDDISFQICDREINRRRLGFGSEIVCVYSGGAQNYQCIEETCKIVLKLKSIVTGLKWLVLTNDREEFNREIMRSGISAPEDTIILSISREEVPGYLASADVAFLIRRNHLVNYVACPTKFGEYLAAGLPVIATSFAGHSAEFIKQFGVGCIIEENVDKIDGKLLSLKIKDLIGEHIRTKCIEVAKRDFAWAGISKRVVEMYRNMCILPEINKGAF